MKEFWLRQKMFWTVILSMGVLPLNGCVYLVVGGIGAVGGYVASPDTVEGTVLDRSYNMVWEQAVDALSLMGMIEDRDEAGGILTARIQGASVKVKLFNLGVNSVKVNVKARKGPLPKVKIAQDVYVKIVSELDLGQ